MLSSFLKRSLFSISGSSQRCGVLRNFASQTGDTGTKQLDAIEKSFNQVILLGRVGNNPESRGTDQNPVVTFSLATNSNFSKNEELIQHTQWHRVSIFKPYLRDKVSRYMQKGARVMVTGRISYMERKDSANPNIVYKNASIVAEEVIFFNK